MINDNTILALQRQLHTFRHEGQVFRGPSFIIQLQHKGSQPGHDHTCLKLAVEYGHKNTV